MIRSGAALVEALIAAVLTALVAAAGTALLQAQSRVATDVTLRSERNDAARSASLTLQAELRELAPRSDVRAIARDSIAVRIFRGVGIVCGTRGQYAFMRYRGLRLPDPVKDSVLQLVVENAVKVDAAFTQNDACVRNSDETVVGLITTAPPITGSMWLVFESGSYHLSTYALRYRRGTESRQPITNEVIDDRRSAFTAVSDSAVRGVVVSLKDRQSSAVRRNVIRFQNAR